MGTAKWAPKLLLFWAFLEDNIGVFVAFDPN